MTEFERQLEALRPGDFGIIGDPVAHSLSPAMQNEAFSALARTTGQQAPRYHLFHLNADELEEGFQRLKHAGLRGLNITVPHKTAAVELVDRLEGFARDAGAINTVLFEEVESIGHNTDGPGFGQALVDDLKFDPKGKTALVLGAGGTGTVLVRQLLRMGARSVFWWNRGPDRLAAEMSKVASPAVHAVKHPKDLKPADAQLIVNATSVGLEDGDGLPADGIPFERGHVVMDTIYHRDTAFLKAARDAGARGGGGLGMLLHQGALAFEIWTGVPAPLEKMKTALTQTLEKKGQKLLWQFGT